MKKSQPACDHVAPKGHPELLTAQELAPIFKVNSDTVLRWGRNGWVPRHIVNGRLVRFVEAEVRESMRKLTSS